MKLLKKIKLNYNLKLLKDYCSNQKFEDAYDLIQTVKKKDKIDFYLLLKNSQELLTNLPTNFYKKKIIWTISYDISDVSYINKFLDHYLKNNLNLSFNIENFANLLNNYFTNLDAKSQVKDIVFNDYLTQSNLYQNIVLLDSDKEYLFLNTCASFFETSKKTYFIQPNLTFCYFYIINNPSELTLRFKQKHNTIEAAYDELFNFSDQQYLGKEQENKTFKVYEYRKNFNVNVKSWTDENVINSFKGKIISYEKLKDDTQSVLLEILYHLKQYGMPIKIDINNIKNFIENNKLSEKIDGDLSNNERKFLNKNLDPELNIHY